MMADLPNWTNMTLGDVLEGYAVETPDGNDNAVLRDWIARHPEFADDLADFAAARAIVRHTPDEEPSADEEARDRKLASERLAGVLEQLRKAPEISSLTQLASDKGLNKSAFANALGLSLSLLMYLEKRRLDVASVPRRIVARIGELLGTGESAVAAYLSKSPDALPQANYKAALMPKAVGRKDFAAAVAEDQTLSPEQKRNLLKMAAE